MLEVQIGGEREEQLDIIIDQNKIAYGLNLNEILNLFDLIPRYLLAILIQRWKICN